MGHTTTTASRPATALYCGAGIVRCGKPGRLYTCGVRCPDHTPAAVAGRPDAPTDTYGAARMKTWQGTRAVNETQAVADARPPTVLARRVLVRSWCPVCCDHLDPIEGREGEEAQAAVRRLTAHISPQHAVKGAGA